MAAAISREKRTLYLFLGIGLALLYAVLFRIVARASRRLRHLALHDALTGLPNRTLFHERVERAIKGMRPDRTVAVLLVDLDRFKEVNDTLGHDHGDELLKVVAERLGGALREGDTLARLGGDEFAVVLTDLPHRGAAAETAGRLHDALRRPFGLRGIAVELDASVGVALSPEHGRDVTTLIQRADVAMYDAKRTQGRVETYSTERDPYSPARLSLLGELRRAIEGDELVLHYQPKVSLDGDRVTGVEALVRWQHPRARAAAARPVRPARRAHGHDRAPHALGARRRAAPVRRVAARVPGPDRRGQPGGRQRARRRPAGDGDRAARRARPARRARSSARSPSTP